MPIFDAYIFVDWSAKNEPGQGKDTIWIGHGLRTGKGVAIETQNPRTRYASDVIVGDLLYRHITDGWRVLIGYDFPYGYSYGFGKKIKDDPNVPDWLGVWRRLTNLLRDNQRNVSNRFKVAAVLNRELGNAPGPFWACPPSGESEHLGRYKSPFPHPSSLPEYRLVEQRLRASKKGAFSAWQLFGAGSVGSQALTGIPWVNGLRFAPGLAPISKVWPFETGWGILGDEPLIVHAEIWPGAVDIEYDPERGVRDQQQVEALVTRAMQEDDAGELIRAFGKPAGLDDQDSAKVLQAEGWILWA